jgi:FkbM family methyltransferase
MINLPMPDPTNWMDLIASQKGILAFDVGANQGIITALLAKNFESVIAIEPCIESFNMIVSTYPKNCTAINQAVSSRIGTLEMSANKSDLEYGMVITLTPRFINELQAKKYDPNPREIECTTIDDLVKKFGIPDLIKVDVEGDEIEVIKGAAQLLSNCKTKWLIEIHPTISGDELWGFFDQNLYKREIVRHSHYLPENWNYNRHMLYMITPKTEWSKQ